MTEGDTMDIPETMAAVLLTGHGGLDKLEYRTDVPTPRPGRGQVIIKVAAAGVNNTDVNTRVGWYSKSVTTGTGSGSGGFDEVTDDGDGAWTGEPLAFPRIQGADCHGEIVAVGDAVMPARIGERVLVRSMQSDPSGPWPVSCKTFGSDFDGAFAQYAVADARHALPVESDWSEVELASIPCAYSTAEGLIDRVGLGAERVLVTGASGGVGIAAVQLAKRRGAEVVAMAGPSKSAAVLAVGADRVIARDADLGRELGLRSVDVVLDVVAGPLFPQLVDVLRPGGRYGTVGAIAGPIVELDVRTLYLSDLTFHGCTYQPDHVFENLIGYIERDEIRPVVAATYPLADIARAQEDFVAKKHAGKLVLVPPGGEQV